MQHAHARQHSLELFANAGWTPRVAGGPLRVVTGGRAARDVASARGYDADILDGGPDATLVLTLGAADVPARMDRRRLVLDLDAPGAVETARTWIEQVGPRVLNVAGPRRSRKPGAYGRAYAFLSRVLAKAHA